MTLATIIITSISKSYSKASPFCTCPAIYVFNLPNYNVK